MTYKIVFLDIDGTILTKQKTIPPQTRKAILSLQEQGITVTLATGRSYLKTIDIAEELGITSMITYNGSYVMHDGTVLHANPIEKTLAHAFIQEVHRKKGVASAHGLQMEHYTDTDNPIFRLACDLHFSHSPVTNTPLDEIGDIYSMTLYASTIEEREYYESRFPELSFTYWNTMSLCCDIAPFEGSKAVGIAHLLRHLGIEKEQAAAFGDGENDIDMLSYVGAGFAMGNGYPNLTNYARFQTKSVEEDGVYHGLKQLGLLRN